MVSSKLVFLSGALQAAFATASFATATTNTLNARQGGGEAVLSNRCDYDVWIQSVDQNWSSEMIKVPARSKHIEPIRFVCEGCGVSLKVSKADHIIQGQHTQFEYSIAAGELWYNISLVDCAKGESGADCPGHELGLGIDAKGGACPAFKCPGGAYCPTEAYFVDQPLIKLGIEEPVKSCGKAVGTGVTMYFKVCSERPALDKKSVAGRVAIEGQI